MSKPRMISASDGTRLVLLIALTLLTTLAPAQTSRDQSDNEEYEVDSAAIQHLSDLILGKPKLIVIHEETHGDDRLQSALERIAHPEPQKRQTEDPALTREVDPAKRQKALDLIESERRRILENPSAFAQKVSDQTVLDWSRRNYEPFSLSNKFRTSTRIFVLSEAEVSNLKGEKQSPRDFWPAFRAKYLEACSAIVRISRVGFNRERNQAVVEMGYTAGPVGGEGWYVLLGKENGVWKVHYLLGAWIS